MELAGHLEQAMKAEKETQPPNTGNSYSFVLDIGANPSYLMPSISLKHKLTPKKHVINRNGSFTTNKQATVLMKKKEKTIRTKAFIHKNLPFNLLSVSPIIDKLGALLLDNQGAASLPSHVYKLFKPTLNYFGRRINKVYQVPLSKGAICLQAGAKSPTDAISDTSHRESQTEKVAEPP